MNHRETLITDLARDEMLSAVGRKRNGRRLGKGLAVTAIIMLAAKLNMSNPEAIDQTLISNPTPEKSEPLIKFHQIESDEELLLLLADQGPIIVTDYDGKSRLILTNGELTVY